MATMKDEAAQAPAAEVSPTPKPAPYIPTYRVSADDKGERVVVQVGKDGKETPVTTAPAEAWAELEGHVDPTPTPAMPRHPVSAYQRWMYEAAKVQWGGTKDAWRPGAPGKEMTLEEYRGHVTAALGARGTSTGEPPAKEK